MKHDHPHSSMNLPGSPWPANKLQQFLQGLSAQEKDGILEAMKQGDPESFYEVVLSQARKKGFDLTQREIEQCLDESVRDCVSSHPTKASWLDVLKNNAGWLAGMFFFCVILPLLTSNSGKSIVRGIGRSISAVSWWTLCKYAGIEILVFAGLLVVIWLLVKLMTGGGYSVDRSHEWRLMGRDGKPGAHYRDATTKDVYEHQHGHGSWERRNETIRSVSTFASVGAWFAAGAIVWPHLQAHGVGGLGCGILFFLWPVGPIAVVVIAGMLLAKFVPKIQL